MSTSTDTWQLSDVTGELERHGYQRIVAGSDARLWYLSPKSTAAAEQYVVLDHKKTFRIYGVSIGFSNNEIRHLRNELAGVVLAELGKSLSMRARCWTTFDVGLALQWPLLGIPYPRERSFGFSQFRQMTEFLATVLEPIDGPAAMLDRLAGTDSPFDWAVYNNPLRRVVEVVATAKVAGHDIAEVEKKLLRAQSQLNKELRTGPRWPELVEQICSR